MSFDIKPDGVLGACVHKETFSCNDSYGLVVGPNQDVLLMMGIACCIDRIHEEYMVSRHGR